jgi:hypothetical protein
VTVSFEVPRAIEEAMKSLGKEPSQAAKEATLVALFRQGRIDHSQLASALGISRYEADGLLKQHGVMLDETVERVAADADDLRRLVQR